MSRVCPVGAVLIGLLGLTVAGCSGGSGAKITGSVTLDGQPLSDARVEFHPRDNLNLSVAVAQTNQEGKFEILARPKSKEILPPGEYVVFVRKLVDKSGNVPSAEDYGQKEAAGELVNKVPAKYSDRNFPQNLIKVEVKSDTKVLSPFELTSK